jgi:hypothetical protein
VKFLFPKWTNKINLLIVAGVPLLLIGLVGFIWYFFSPKFLWVGYEPDQPIPFSHKLHAGTLGLDCRYCHATVEKTDFAALPPTEVCVGCHNKVKKDSPRLVNLWKSVQEQKPIPWIRIIAFM